MITIRRKLIIYLILPMLGIGLLYFSISRYYTQKEFLSTLEERAIEDSNRLANSIQDVFLANDRIPLTDVILSEKFSNAHIKYITVFNVAGEVIAHGDLDAAPNNISPDQSGTTVTSGYINYEGVSLFNVDRPILSGLYRIGMARIGFDFNDVVNTFNYTAYWFIGIGLLFLISITLFVFKLSRRITQPITELKEVSLQFAQGNFTNRAHVYAADEVGDLAKSFNTMADALNVSKDQIEQEKMVLQDKIGELEKWQQSTIGRELKMVELKKALAKHQEESHEDRPTT